MIGISNYEGLVNRNFNLPEEIRARAQDGYMFYRVFTDLGWGGESGNLKPDENIYLYEYDKEAKRFDPTKINAEFVTKLHESARAAKQGGMEGITLCLATKPLYYKESTMKDLPWQLGYREIHNGFVKEPKEGFIQVVNIERPEWKTFEKYFTDLAKVCADAPNPMRLRWFETCNELKRWGSILDSHPRMWTLIRKQKSNALFQMNPPLTELHDGVDEVGMEKAFSWPKRLMSSTGVKGFRAHRVAFHGFFTGDEVIEEANFLKRGGLDINRIVFESDGATPNTIYTMDSHAKHYLWRTSWDDNVKNTNMTIEAHRGLIAGAKKAGVHFIIQNPIKWSLMQETPSLQRFHEEMAKEILA